MVQAKKPGAQTTRTVDLSLIFSEELGDAPEPYERLLGDALRGDSSLFTREDSVEETWRIVQPLLDSPPPVETYARVVGTGGREQVAGRVPTMARAVAAFSRNALEVIFRRRRTVFLPVFWGLLGAVGPKKPSFSPGYDDRPPDRPTKPPRWRRPQRHGPVTRGRRPPPN